jgi:hypothetical protein
VRGGRRREHGARVLVLRGRRRKAWVYSYVGHVKAQGSDIGQQRIEQNQDRGEVKLPVAGEVGRAVDQEHAIPGAALRSPPTHVVAVARRGPSSRLGWECSGGGSLTTLTR